MRTRASCSLRFRGLTGDQSTLRRCSLQTCQAGAKCRPPRNPHRVHPQPTNTRSLDAHHVTHFASSPAHPPPPHAANHSRCALQLRPQRHGGPAQPTNQPHTRRRITPPVSSKLLTTISPAWSPPSVSSSTCSRQSSIAVPEAPGLPRRAKSRRFRRNPRQFGQGDGRCPCHRVQVMSGPSSDAQFGVTVTGLQSSRQVAVAYIVRECDDETAAA
jgi:hypothetical protein